MVTETLVKEALSKDMIEAGATLARRLEANNFPTTAALWFFNVDSSSWRYVIASAQVDLVGIKLAYKKVQETLSALASDEMSINLRDITLLSPNDPLVHLLKTGIKTGNGMSGIRFTKNLINGVLIEDAFIYRLI